MPHIEERIVTRKIRSIHKGTTHVTVVIEGMVPKGLIKNIQTLIAECNKSLDDNSLVSYEIQTHQCQ